VNIETHYQPENEPEDEKIGRMTSPVKTSTPHKTPVKTQPPRTTRQSTPTYVAVEEVDSPPPPSSPPPATPPPDPRDEVIQKLSRELSEMRKKLAAQTTGPTLTDVEFTTRLERLPAPAPVQAQETLFMAVFKEQAAANREMMREQAMSRENTAALVAAVLKLMPSQVHIIFCKT